MKRIYLDNAATTPVLPEVAQVMLESLTTNFGNPSSTHQFGRTAKSSIENARKNIAKHFNVSSSEIVFTSGGTEADNLILQNAVVNLGVEKIITSKIEHHAVLHTVEFLQKKHAIEVIYLKVDAKGNIDIEELRGVLGKDEKKTLVTLMWVNNEIGNILPIEEVALLCKEYKALFHSDTVQGIGHYELDLQRIPIDFMVASAHKFHGPKGVGFVFVRKGILIQPILHGGDQERGIRSSTENVHAILGMEKALDIAYNNLKEDKHKIEQVKSYFINELIENVPGVKFNGESANISKSSYTVLNVRFPYNNKMMLFTLDIRGIAASGGSACQSGSAKGSHVLQAFLGKEESEKTSVRFSFSKFNTKEEVDGVLKELKGLKN